MKTEKQLRKHLLQHLKNLKKSAKKYAVFGTYEDDDDVEYSVWQVFDTKEECYDYWCDVEAGIRDSRYDRLTNDPEILEECKEDYEDEWDDMDEDEREDALDQHVIHMYCNWDAINPQINLVWFDLIELIDSLIDEIKSDDELDYDATKHKIHDKLITIKTRRGGKKTGLMLEEPNWNILGDLSYDPKANCFSLDDPQYRVRCLIDGQIDEIPLYGLELRDHYLSESGILDHNFETN